MGLSNRDMAIFRKIEGKGGVSKSSITLKVFNSLKVLKILTKGVMFWNTFAKNKLQYFVK